MSSQRAESHGPVEIISHWHPNLTINMVDDHTAWVKGSVPPPLDQRKFPPFQPSAVHFLRICCSCFRRSSSELAVTFPFSRLPSDVKFDAVSGDYYPIVYFNDYWNLQKDYYPINDTLTTLPLRLSYCPISLWRWQLYAAQNARSPWNFLPEDTYEQSDEDQDSVKVSERTSFHRWNIRGLRGKIYTDLKCFFFQVALLETNPYLLGLTIVVSIVHSIFEFLAFKNGKNGTSNQV